MDTWLDKINLKLGGGDAMFVSNMLRSVPQVRHLDVDCFLYDYTAGVPVVVIEESKNIRKADRMTRQLASYLGCVQARVITLMDESDTFHTTVRDGERTIVHKGGGGYGLIEETVRKKLQRTNWWRK